ncbi:UDP-glucose dehydrogenase family protein [Streptomyces sp. URMC 123]|uniref:UDP-glucose dehydrogenase family protein n=1 Tax=Streptomyces sp. URMC 123 TaxID=3423403 RepID=UPI003F1CF88F
MRIAVVGQGYVGVTGAVALAQQGHRVIGIEQDAARLRSLTAGRAPVFEPGLQEELSRALGTGNLRFAPDVVAAHAEAPFDLVMITVGTPAGPAGEADLRQVAAVLRDVVTLRPDPCVVLKSTVPPGTSDGLLDAHPELRDRYAYNPEFLNQGSALEDWTAPSRVVVGVRSRRPLPLLRRLYEGVTCPWVVTTPGSAEMTKYASNAFLAMKISFANEIARLCSGPELDIDHVMRGVGCDPRIGHAFLQPGLGFGDSCLPKDTAALARWAADRALPTPLLDAAIAVNAAQPRLVPELLHQELGSALRDAVIAVLGVRYEPWSDDLRAAPSRAVVPRLLAEAGLVRVWDPATPPELITRLFPGAVPVPDLPGAVRGAHAAVILTEWPETVEADWPVLATELAAPRVVVDGKNCLTPARLAGLPVVYRCIGGRPLAPPTGPKGPGEPGEPTAQPEEAR